MFASAEGIIALAVPATACRCGTGHYCRLHHKYGLPTRDRSGKLLASRPVVVERNVKGYSQCGGGIRINRKPVGN